MIAGRATEEGTARYAGRSGRDVLPEHFRLTERGLRLSSVGVGTYLGREDEATDGLYRRSIARALERSEFMRRLRAAFTACEEAVAAGKMARYGTATWNGYREPPGTPGLLLLADVVAAAREVGGADHHFRAIQLPYNLAMT